jgi:hypothetical protein
MLAVAVAIVVVSIAGSQEPSMPGWVWLTPLLIVGIVSLFSSLHIAVDRDCLHWSFGPGIWRKSILLSNISAVDITRTTFWNGWGIRWTRRGWLYNVAGFDAVMVTTRDGKSVLLGTDEPSRLAAALRNAAALK